MSIITTYDSRRLWTENRNKRRNENINTFTVENFNVVRVIGFKGPLQHLKGVWWLLYEAWPVFRHFLAVKHETNINQGRLTIYFPYDKNTSKCQINFAFFMHVVDFQNKSNR